MTMGDHRSSNLDRGWAWIITAAVFGSNILCVGYFRAFGVFFVEIIETFDTSSSVTSLIMGVQNAVFCVAALLVHNVLLQLVTVRTSAVIGGFLMATGMTLATFASTVTYLIFFLGVLVGIGNSMTYGPGMVLLGQYFERRRALAIALANTGSSVGSMTLPLLATHLLQHYGLRGAWLLYGAVTLHLCVFTGLYRPLERQDTAENVKEQTDDVEEADQALLAEKGQLPQVNCEPQAPDKDFLWRGQSEKDQSSDVRYEDRQKGNGGGDAVLQQDQGERYSLAHRYLSGLTKEEGAKAFSSANDVYLNAQMIGDFSKKISLTVGDLRSSHRSHHGSGSVKSLSPVVRRFRSFAMHASHPHLMIQTPSYKYLQDQEHSDGTSSQSSEDETKPQCLKDSFKSFSCDGDLLKNPLFWLVQVYVCAGVLGASGAGSYLPSLCRERGLDPDETAIVLITWGGVNLVGRLMSGLVADRQWLRPSRISALAFLVIGSLFQLLPVLPHSLPAMLVVGVVYGLFEGAYFTMLPVIIIDFVSLDNFSRTFGFAQLFQGAFASLMYPILGKLRDETGDYQATFHCLGACALMATFLLMLEPAERLLKKTPKNDTA